MGFTLQNGCGYTVTLDITKEMHAKPTGGVITVYVDASQIPDDIINQKPHSGGGFNASVDDWTNEINAEITI